MTCVFFYIFGTFVTFSTEHVGKAFPRSARPTLRYISSEFGCRSPLRRPHPGKISHKLWRTSCRKPFFRYALTGYNYFLQRLFYCRILFFRNWKFPSSCYSHFKSADRMDMCRVYHVTLVALQKQVPITFSRVFRLSVDSNSWSRVWITVWLPRLST